MADTEKTNLKITQNPQKPEQMKSSLPAAKDKSERSDRRIEHSQISGSGSSIATRDNSIEISSDSDTHITMANGTIESDSLQRSINSNRMDIHVDEININNHLLNNRIYEMTDFKQVTTGIYTTGLVGNFCISGTVLVKAWEPDLKRYVFIRRPCRMPMFSPAIAPPSIKDGLGVVDPTKAVVNLVGVMNKAAEIGKKAVDQVNSAKEAISGTTNSSSQKLESNEAPASDSGNQSK